MWLKHDLAWASCKESHSFLWSDFYLEFVKLVDRRVVVQQDLHDEGVTLLCRKHQGRSVLVIPATQTESPNEIYAQRQQHLERAMIPAEDER